MTKANRHFYIYLADAPARPGETKHSLHFLLALCNPLSGFIVLGDVDIRVWMRVSESHANDKSRLETWPIDIVGTQDLQSSLSFTLGNNHPSVYLTVWSGGNEWRHERRSPLPSRVTSSIQTRLRNETSMLENFET